MAAAAKPKSLAEALLRVQGEIQKVAKDGTAQYGAYATLPAIVEVINPILQKAGLVYSQVMDQSSTGQAALRTCLMHPESDQMLEGTCPFPANLDAQKMGSAVTYFRRYGLLSILGIVADVDDDGALASAVRGRAGAATPTVTAESITAGEAATAALQTTGDGVLPAAGDGLGGPVTL